MNEEDTAFFTQRVMYIPLNASWDRWLLEGRSGGRRVRSNKLGKYLTRLTMPFSTLRALRNSAISKPAYC